MFEESNKIPTTEDMAHMIFDVLVGLRDMKPNNRSELDRKYAVMITDMEKINAYFNHYVVNAQYIDSDNKD